MSNNFKSTIKLPQAVALYIGAVLGSGILIVPGLAAEIAGPASMLSWAGMMVLVLPLALCMAFLAQKYPNAGGVSHFVSRAFGDKAGAVVGWFFLASVPIGAPVASLTGAGYLSSALGLGEGTRITIAAFMLLFALIINVIGMNVAGNIQVAVVLCILLVLLLSIFGSIPNIQASHFTPFMPNGFRSVGKASAILFWCFIGWEAVSHLSEEFVNPEKDVIRATTIAAIVVGILYFMTAFATVGTRSYGSKGTEVPLILVARKLFGSSGALIVGLTSLLICTATVVAYVGAASRLAYSLAKRGDAPKFLGKISQRFKTPVGGLSFLTVCFTIIIILYGSKLITITALIQLPNATFILTYLAGCASGLVLLKESKFKFIISAISFTATAIIFTFVGWASIYPVVIAVLVIFSKLIKKNNSVLKEDVSS